MGETSPPSKEEDDFSTKDSTTEEMYAHSEVRQLCPPLPFLLRHHQLHHQVFDERTEELFSFLQVLTACVGTTSSIFIIIFIIVILA